MRKICIGLVGVLVLGSMAMGQTKAAPKKNLPPPLEVGRAGAGTPEITGMHPTSIENGKETEVVVKGRDFPDGATLTASRECKLIRAKQISATEARFTIISISEKGGYCNLEIKGKKKSTDDTVEVKPTAAYQAILDKKKAEDDKAYAARQAKENEAAKERIDFALKKAPELVGKTWEVKLPNGKSDTWTLTEKGASGGKFKSSSGLPITVIVMQEGNVMVVPEGGGCMMQGKLKDGKVSGEQSMAPSFCKLGQGKWSATINQ